MRRSRSDPGRHPGPWQECKTVSSDGVSVLTVNIIYIVSTRNCARSSVVWANLYCVQTGLWPTVEPISHPSASANARGSALVLRGVSLVLRGFTLVLQGRTVGLGALHSSRRAGCAALASLPPGLGAAHSASGCGTCPAGCLTCPAGIRTCPAGPISRFVLSQCCPCVSMHAH